MIAYLDQIGEGVHHVLVRLPHDTPEAVAISWSTVHRQATGIRQELHDRLDVFLQNTRMNRLLGTPVHKHRLVCVGESAQHLWVSASRDVMIVTTYLSETSHQLPLAVATSINHVTS